MIKHLTQHGNSLALLIDKAILEILKIDAKTPLEISTDGKSLVISPARKDSRAQKIKSALVKINQAHGKTLKKLGE